MGKNLRHWLSDVEKRFPGELLRCPLEIASSGFTASALLENFERQSKYPAVLFERLTDLHGDPSTFRLLMNTFATIPKMGVALGAEVPKRLSVMERYMKMQASPKDTVAVEKAKSPVKEIIWTGNDVDLRKLPLARINEMDGGPYSTPIVVSRHPQTGRYNVSWNRCMLIDRNHLGIWMSPRHLWTYFMTAEELGNSVPVAIILGHHPAFFLVGAGLTKMDQDEYRVAGGVMGEGIEVVPSETFGSDLVVPSESEIILEGEVVKIGRASCRERV
jgi:2,5-furandicarboxylate decarboxylase 1